MPPVTGSSRAWVARQLRDPFVLQANIENYRSRAAYKLLDLQKRFRLISRGDAVIDLGAAPGSWSQVAAQLSGSRKTAQLDSIEIASKALTSSQQLQPSTRRPSVFDIASEELNERDQSSSRELGSPNMKQQLSPSDKPSSVPFRQSSGSPTGIVVGVDLSPIEPLPGVITILGDFTRPSVQALAFQAVQKHRGVGVQPFSSDVASSASSGNKASLVDVLLSDMAHNFTGEHHTDHLRQMLLSWTALLAAPTFLRREGNTAIKVRYGQEYKPFLTAMQRRFLRVVEVKPPASRQESAESFIVGLGWCGKNKALDVVTQEEIATLTDFGLAWPEK